MAILLTTYVTIALNSFIFQCLVDQNKTKILRNYLEPQFSLHSFVGIKITERTKEQLKQNSHVENEAFWSE